MCAALFMFVLNEHMCIGIGRGGLQAAGKAESDPTVFSLQARNAACFPIKQSISHRYKAVSGAGPGQENAAISKILVANVDNFMMSLWNVPAWRG